jgi:hypothetical protein
MASSVTEHDLSLFESLNIFDFEIWALLNG